MQKPIAASIALSLALSGCSLFKTSPTWEKMVQTRQQIHGEPGDQAVAGELHRILNQERVEHKVVNYQFRYYTALREEAVGAGAAVIYRDSTTPDHPWWLMDQRSHTPVWLPNEPLERQLAFYLRRRAEVIDAKDFQTGRHLEEKDPGNELSRYRSASPQDTSYQFVRAKGPRLSAGKEMIAARSGAKPVQTAMKPRQAPIKPAMYAAARTSQKRVLFRSSRPVALAPVRVQPVALPKRPNPAPAAPAHREFRADRIEIVFRRQHGTDFDPASRADRRKMNSLRRLS